MDTLTCCVCKETIAFTDGHRLHGQAANEAAKTFVGDLEHKHARFCVWRCPQQPRHDLVAFPAADSGPICATFALRASQISAIAALPAIGGRGLAHLTNEAMPQLISLLRAASVPAMVRSSSPSSGSCDLVFTEAEQVSPL